MPEKNTSNDNSFKTDKIKLVNNTIFLPDKTINKVIENRPKNTDNTTTYNLTNYNNKTITDDKYNQTLPKTFPLKEIKTKVHEISKDNTASKVKVEHQYNILNYTKSNLCSFSDSNNNCNKCMKDAIFDDFTGVCQCETGFFQNKNICKSNNLLNI
jgi:hypothetical protein